MAAGSSAAGCVERDPLVMAALFKHLNLIKGSSDSPMLEIGTEAQLSTIVKIIDSDDIRRAIFDDVTRRPKYWPILPKGQYLIACIDKWTKVNVVAVYAFDQIVAIEATRGGGAVRNLTWKAMEISEELAKEIAESFETYGEDS